MKRASQELQKIQRCSSNSPSRAPRSSPNERPSPTSQPQCIVVDVVASLLKNSGVTAFATPRWRNCVDADRDVPSARLTVAASVCRAGVPSMDHLRVTMFPSRPRATIAARHPRNLSRSPVGLSPLPHFAKRGTTAMLNNDKTNHTFKVCV